MRKLKDVPPFEPGVPWQQWMLARNAAEDAERKQALRTRGYQRAQRQWEPMAEAPKEQVVKQRAMFGERKAA